MNNLSDDLENLRKEYREIFLKTYEEFNQKLATMSDDDAEKFLKEDAIKQAYAKQLEIVAHKKNFSCGCCGACCKLACSEFSPEELAFKAQNGDVIANEFISTFIPYQSEAEAQKNYPEYFEMLKAQKQEQIYFYHCPKVTADNKCSDYENRPSICKNFPDNPIEFLPKTCSYCQWKADCQKSALSINAQLEIIWFFLK